MRFLLVALSMAAVGMLADAGDARADSIVGAWSGGGTVRLDSGTVERVRCRVSYHPSTGRTFMVNATCAHAGGTFQQDGRIVQVSSSRYTGRLYNSNYDVSGRVSIHVNGRYQKISVSSSRGSATLTLTRR